jgi:hypothetical protein
VPALLQPSLQLVTAGVQAPAWQLLVVFLLAAQVVGAHMPPLGAFPQAPALHTLHVPQAVLSASGVQTLLVQP